MNRLRITPSIIPNLFTSMNMFCGFFSIISASEGNFVYAGWLVIAAAVFDALDGFMARLTKSSSELGVELDSLSDVVSFGAAPSFLIYSTYLFKLDAVGIVISSFPLIAGGFRLARFNVQLVGFEKKSFTGLPIPSAAITIIAFILAFYNEGFSDLTSKFIVPLIILLSLLMISNIKYDTLPKFSLKEIKKRPVYYSILLLALIYLLIDGVKALFFIFVFMIVFGIFRQLINYISNKTTE